MGYASRPESGTLPCMTFSLSKTLSAVTTSPASTLARIRSLGKTHSMIIAVYVDDLVLSSNIPSVVTSLKTSFASRFNITDLGPLDSILGIKVTRDLRRNKCFYLSQASFIRDAISKFGLDFLPACRTPMNATTDLTPTPGFKSSLPDSNRYRSMVGTLAWVANWTRPELAFTVHKLQRYQSNPEPKHFEATQRAFRYLKGTQSERLRLGGDLVLRAYTDDAD
mmetsp:Transcript_16335/g.25244  ORF Transcript_16335/g.25244 Transcript_16335/m.25244 type:complete len:223 (+) Transcript_16335:475-1143(+)